MLNTFNLQSLFLNFLKAERIFVVQPLSLGKEVFFNKIFNTSSCESSFENLNLNPGLIRILCNLQKTNHLVSVRLLTIESIVKCKQHDFKSTDAIIYFGSFSDSDLKLMLNRTSCSLNIYIQKENSINIPRASIEFNIESDQQRASLKPSIESNQSKMKVVASTDEDRENFIFSEINEVCKGYSFSDLDYFFEEKEFFNLSQNFSDADMKKIYDDLQSLNKNLSRPAVFFDRDGVLVHDVPYNADPEKVVLRDQVELIFHWARKNNYFTVMVSNQSGIGRGTIPSNDYHLVHEKMISMLNEKKAHLNLSVFSSNYSKGVWPIGLIGPQRRKPRTGMISEAVDCLRIDLEKSILIGDSHSDIIAAYRAGIGKIFLISDGNQSRFEQEQKKLEEFKISLDQNNRDFNYISANDFSSILSFL